MHDKVTVVDRFSFQEFFTGAKSIVMQTSIVFSPNFAGGPLVEESDYQIL